MKITEETRQKIKDICDVIIMSMLFAFIVVLWIRAF